MCRCNVQWILESVNYFSMCDCAITKRDAATVKSQKENLLLLKAGPKLIKKYAFSQSSVQCPISPSLNKETNLRN